MASVGLRFRTATAGSLLRVCQTTQPIHRPLAWTRWGALTRREHSSTASDNDHFYMSEFGLFTEFYRKPFRQWPSLFSKKGLKYLKTNIVEWFRDIWSLVMLKFKLSGWSKKKFSKDAELMYTVMNEAYAQGDLMTLEKMCKPMMYSKLKADVKRRRMAFDWEVVRTVVPTKVIKVRCGKVMPRLSLGQVTVRFDQIQRVRSVPGALVARQGAKSKHAVASSGIAAKEKRVVEYYVFQREMINDNSPWSIYRKIDVPEWDLPKQ